MFPTVRIRQFLNNPLYIFFWLKRYLFYKKSSFKYVSQYSDIKQLDENDTLKYIIENNLSIVRFGDGEFGLLTGAGIFCGIKGFFKFSWYQSYSRKLKKELTRIISSTNDSILVSFPPIWHIIYDDRIQHDLSNTEKIYSNMHVEARMLLWKLIHKNRIYGSWSVFMPQHNNSMNWNLIADYFKDKHIVIVTGGVDRLRHVQLGYKTHFIETGKYNAFEKRKTIFKDIDTYVAEQKLQKDSTLFLISLGPTAACVVEYISNQGHIAWDTGHLFEYAEKEISKISAPIVS